MAVGWYTAKQGTSVVARYVEARLGKPSLVRDTSRVTPLETIKHPIKTIQTLFRKADDPLKGVILSVSSLIFYCCGCYERWFTFVKEDSSFLAIR